MVNFLLVSGKPVSGVSGVTVDYSEDGMLTSGNCGVVFEFHEGIFSAFVNGHPMQFVGTGNCLETAVHLVAGEAFPGVEWTDADKRDFPHRTVAWRRR